MTFDDGYRDNYTDAYPILAKYRVPATIFVATGFIETSRIFWWDRIYETFRSTNEDRLDLTRVASLVGQVRALRSSSLSLGSPEQRACAAEAVIGMMESTSEDRIERTIESIQELLGDARKDDTPPGRTLSWEQIRELSQNGVSIQSHTHHHPFLSTLDVEGVERELRTSKAILEEKTGKEVCGLAYPGGRAGMYNAATMSSAKRVGYRYACIAEPGSFGPGSDPFAIRRVPVGDDSLPILAHRLLSAYQRV